MFGRTGRDLPVDQGLHFLPSDQCFLDFPETEAVFSIISKLTYLIKSLNDNVIIKKT